MRSTLLLITFTALSFLLGAPPVLALDPSLEVNQYAHTAWTTRNGFSLGNIYAITQTPDGYLWLGTESGLVRFDGVRSVPWQPPAGQHLPDTNINSLLVTRDGTLWIGTFAGLATWRDGKLALRPELGREFVASLFEDREGTLWAATLNTPTGRLCAIRSDSKQCYGEDGSFGRAVWALFEDSSGNLWAAAESGLWRIKPGPPRRYKTPMELIGLSRADDGRMLIAMHGGGLLQFAGDKLTSYPLRRASNSRSPLREHDVDSNRLLRDRDGGLWIGSVERGILHVHQGRADVFSRADSLSGDVILSMFEDREGNVWVASTGGLDRFRELPVSTVALKQGVASDATQSVLAATDGSIWIGAHEGLTRWKNGKATIFRKGNGLPDDAPESLFQDDRGRIWVSTRHGLACFKDGRFVTVNAVRGEVHFITGDRSGNLWLSEHRSFLHLLDGRLIEQIPWSELGRHQSAEVLLSGPEPGGVWLGFWVDGGVSYFKDHQLRTSYTTANGLGKGAVADLRFDQDGALWVSTQAGGLSRIKDGRIVTLSSRNGLPCDTIHWTMEDDDHTFWLYTACGLVRITRTELDAWIADPNRTVQTTVWDAADGVRLRSSAASAYAPRVAKSNDGKLWFVTGEGVQVVDPRRLTLNKLPPPARIEQIIADHKIYWQNLTGAAVSNVRLPPRTRDLQIDYTALSLVAPEKIHFKYRLEGQDRDWREVVNGRQVQYSNLAPGAYRFRVVACNNSGLWNEQGDTLDFSIAPAYYQTNWFRTLCAAALMGLLYALFRLRVWQVEQQLTIGLEAKIAERTRIARDLHDTLLQSFHGLVFRFQAVRNMLPKHPEEAMHELDSALIRAEQALEESRHSIQELRRGLFTSGDLDQMLSATCQELASSHCGENGAPRFEVIVEGERQSLAPMITDEIHRIARELLRNAFQHARAQEIEAEIRYDSDDFCLIVRDDGKGIDPQILKDGGRAGHWGLPGVNERAQEIGARVEFWSQAGAGTEVVLTLPAAIAYERSRNGDRFSLFRKRRTHVQHP
jgi:signal transduction histidine kinase/ligand-binding sensor domain-containing protein